MNIALNRTSKQIVMDLVFFANGVLIDPEVVNWGVPEGYEPLVSDFYKRDTKVVISGRAENLRDYSGRDELFYRRYLLQDQKPVLDMPIYASGRPVNAHSLLSQLNTKFNLLLAPEDVQDTVYNDFTKPFELLAHQDSLAWKGSLKFDVVFAKIPLDIAISNPILVGFTEQETPLDAVDYFRSYGEVFTEFFSENLAEFKAGDVFDQPDPEGWKLGSMILKEQWAYETQQARPRNIAGAQVRYNGFNNEPQWQVDGLDESVCVLVLELGPLCTDYFGYVVIAYNTPEEITA